MDSAASRLLRLKRADEARDNAYRLVRLKDAYESQSSRGTTATPHRVLDRAAVAFVRAAKRYRDAGLGLLSRECWDQAAQCYRRLFDEKRAARCETERDAIPVLWDGDDSPSPSAGES